MGLSVELVEEVTAVHVTYSNEWDIFRFVFTRLKHHPSPSAVHTLPEGPRAPSRESF